MAVATLHLGRTEMRAGNPAEALALLDDAVAQFRAISGSSFVHDARVRRVECLLLLGRSDEALMEADAVHTEIGEGATDPLLRVALHRARARARLGTGDAVSVLALAEEAMARALAAGAPYELAETLLTRADVLDALGARRRGGRSFTRRPPFRGALRRRQDRCSLIGGAPRGHRSRCRGQTASMRADYVRSDEERINWRSSVPFIVVHLVPFAAVITGVSARAIVLCVVLYVTRLLCITAGYHRYFSHRSFRVSRPMQFLMAFAGTTAVQKGPLWWASHHRAHHRYVDTERDPHTPRKGFWWSHVGWILSDRYSATDTSLVADLARYPELRFLNRFDWIGPWALGVAVPRDRRVERSCRLGSFSRRWCSGTPRSRSTRSPT